MLGCKYFGIVKYFFRLTYTSAIKSVPICAVHWINFENLKDSISCSIGRIPQEVYWNTLEKHPTLKNMEFISFNDILPSRFAMSYVQETNIRASWINVAFIALDAEKLGLDNKVHVDFGDNKFSHYLGNKKTTSLDLEQKVILMMKTQEYMRIAI